MDITTPAQRNPPASGDGYERHDPTGGLYFNSPSPPRQFGPFTLPIPESPRTDIPDSRIGHLASSAMPISLTPGQGGQDAGAAPGAFRPSIDFGAAVQAGGRNGIGGVWTTAQRDIGGQTGRMQPGIGLASGVAGPFSENGAPPIGYTDGANQAGTFAPSVADGTRLQPSGPLSILSQPPPAARNLTKHVLRMKGVPDADIGTALNDPSQMRDLLNQLYGRRPMIAPDANEDGFTGNAGRGPLADQPEQATTQRAATPDTYLPFGWAGLPPFQR
jgi:hypothetical protein